MYVCTYGAFDSLWEEKPFVDRVHGVVGFNVALLLQEDGPGVESVISPEDGETSFFVTMDQRPMTVRDSTLNRTLPKLLFEFSF